MALSSVLAFWLVALLLIVVPGTDWAFTIGAGLRSRSVLPAVGGLVTGYAAVTAVVAAGVGALIAATPIVLTGLTLVGGGYLIWHGVTTLAHPATPGIADAPARNTFVQGVGISGLNPKGLLLFLALLPQFTDPDGGWPIAGQIAVLGLTFMVTGGIFYFGLGSLARGVLTARPIVARAVSRCSGAAMVLIGGILALERLIALR